MMDTSASRKWIALWPQGAPWAKGKEDEDVPALSVYPVKEQGNGAVIVCPGGGYGMRADHEGEPIALWLNSLGLTAFVLRYRVAPYRYPCALTDAQRAVRYVRHYADVLGIRNDRIGLLGFSAGGHLTAAAGTHYTAGDPNAADPIERQSSRPDALVLCYPVITMKPPFYHHGSMVNLLGDLPEPSLVESMCTELQVNAETPPTFLWHTSDDKSVPVENSLLFAGALSRAGVPFDLHVYEKGHHGLGLAPGDEHVGTWSGVCAAWLKRRQFY